MNEVEQLVPGAPAARVTLRRDYLSFPETIAQSFANIAPTVTPALSIPLVVASAGNGTWFAYLISTVGLLLVGLNISVFAKRYATAGSIYTYVSQSFGPVWGFISGWSLLGAYIFTGMATLVGFGIFAHILLALSGVPIPNILVYAVGIAIIWFFAYKDIRLSATLALIMELISVSLIAVLGLLVLVHNNFRLDFAQVSLKGVSLSGISLGMVLTVFSYVGFESAATLGKESRNPFRSIPRAVVISSTVAGLFFIFTAYTEILGFPGGMKALESSSAPLNDLSAAYGMKWFGVLTDVGALISFFSCTMASVNAGSRILFAMGQDRLFHTSLGNAHRVNQTPHIAVTISSILVFIAPIFLLKAQPLNAYGYFGTFATYGFLVVYILISVAAPFFLKKHQNLHAGHIALGVGGLLFMLIPLVGSVYPVPPFPYDILPYLFLGFSAVGLIWFFIARKRDPRLSEEVGLDFDANEELIVGRK